MICIGIQPSLIILLFSNIHLNFAYTAKVRNGEVASNFKLCFQAPCLFLVSLSVSFGSIITAVYNQIFWTIVVAAGEVAVKDALDACSITLLRVDGRAGHVRHHGIATTPWVLGIPQWMVLWCWLREPDITTIATEVA